MCPLEAEAGDCNVCSRESRPRLRLSRQRLGGLGGVAPTQTECVWLSLATAGPGQGHPPTQGQLRLRLRHSLSVVSSGCSRHLARHWAECEQIIGLKFRLR